LSAIRIAELLGDGIGPELRESVHSIADALPLDFEFLPFDFSLENRERSDRSLYDEAVALMNDTKLSLKYPTVTSTSSPNAIIRRLCGFSVILRPVISIAGIKTNFKEKIALYVDATATRVVYRVAIVATSNRKRLRVYSWPPIRPGFGRFEL